ncbi:hypothetical protein [Mesobacterium pallidum]|uniref:hypothetical protein n=1 Tax=Mesobacterium pallidum TaxID=2872037 RepID=UPI001EE298BF|nr:hypothetical protein [Mesobacterium pallidum]
MPDRAPDTLAVAFPSALPRVLTGRVELELADALTPRLPRPQRVTAVLTALFDRVGGEAATPSLLWRLATGARAHLLLRAARAFFPARGWFSGRCDGCGGEYDLHLDLGQVPRSEPLEGYPLVTVQTSLGPRRFEVPNGLTEDHLSRDSTADRRTLAGLTGLSDRAQAEAARFTPGDLAAIEAALDEATPDVAEEIQSTCPDCGAGVSARLDPLDFAFPAPDRLDREIFLIARCYGWDEPTILALPSARRRRHAAMIAADGRRGAR